METLLRLEHWDFPLIGDPNIEEPRASEERGFWVPGPTAHHAPEFKSETVRLCFSSGKSIPKVAKDLPVNSHESLRKRVKQSEIDAREREGLANDEREASRRIREISERNCHTYGSPRGHAELSSNWYSLLRLNFLVNPRGPENKGRDGIRVTGPFLCLSSNLWVE